jgi:hypothetical protein
MDWEFGPHTILLRKERKEGVVGRGRPAKRSREERLSSQVRGRTEEKRVFWSQDVASRVMIQADK